MQLTPLCMHIVHRLIPITTEVVHTRNIVPSLISSQVMPPSSLSKTRLQKFNETRFSAGNQDSSAHFDMNYSIVEDHGNAVVFVDKFLSSKFPHVIISFRPPFSSSLIPFAVDHNDHESQGGFHGSIWKNHRFSSNTITTKFSIFRFLNSFTSTASNRIEIELA